MSQSGQEGSGTGQTDGEPNGQQDNGTGTDSAQGTGNGGSDSERNNSTDSNNTVSREDFEKLQRQLSAADQKRSEAEKELQKIKDADLSELDKAKKDMQSVTEERDSALAEVNKLRLENAFLSTNDVTWQNADAALTLARTQGYLDDVVNDKGEVDKAGLKKALKKLSDEHKYLVKKSNDDEEEQTPPSGAPAPGRSNSNDDKGKSDRLKARMPALGRR